MLVYVGGRTTSIITKVITKVSSPGTCSSHHVKKKHLCDNTVVSLIILPVVVVVWNQQIIKEYIYKKKQLKLKLKKSDNSFYHEQSRVKKSILFI